MTYHSKYRNRMNAYGNSQVDSKRELTKKIIESDIKNSPTYYVVYINDSITPIDVRINNKSESNTDVKVLVTLNGIPKGSIVNWNEQKWLSLTHDHVGDVYYKAEIEFCNNTLHIKTGETKVQNGTDSMGRPVYTTTPTFTDLPCIVKSRYYTSDSNSAINLPEGQMLITIPYSNLIKENMEFEMYNRKFKIKGIDFSKVVNESGILTLTVERVV